MFHRKIYDLSSFHDPSNIAEFVDAPILIQYPSDEWDIRSIFLGFEQNGKSLCLS